MAERADAGCDLLATAALDVGLDPEQIFISFDALDYELLIVKGDHWHACPISAEALEDAPADLWHRLASELRDAPPPRIRSPYAEFVA